MAKYLVTGGAGFIGSNLVRALVKLRKEVRVLDNFSTGRRDNLEAVADKIDLIEGDIRNEADVRRAVKNVDFIFHVAANRAVLKSVENPLETHEVNVTGTLNLLSYAKEEGVKRVIFTSSSSVYGDIKHFPTKETDELKPLSPYGLSKVLGEEYCALFSRAFGLDTVSLRYFNVYGPGQHTESRYSLVIPIFVDTLLAGKRPEIHWDGNQTRDFVHIDDVIQANLLAAFAKKQMGAVYNIASAKALSILEIYQNIARELGVSEIKPRFSPKRQGDVRHTLADIRKAKRALGYKANVPFSEGIKQTLNWFLELKGERKKVAATFS